MQLASRFSLGGVSARWEETLVPFRSVVLVVLMCFEFTFASEATLHKFATLLIALPLTMYHAMLFQLALLTEHFLAFTTGKAATRLML
jgi:hypothetical protein